MLIMGYAFTTAMACTSTIATAQPSLSARAPIILPGVEADDEAKKPAQVLCVPQTPGDHSVVVPMHPTIRTRWQLLDPVMSFEFGNASDYNKELDKYQRKRLSIQPIPGASPTNLIIETSAPRTFTLQPVSEPAKAVHLVLIRPEDPSTGEMLPDPRCDGVTDEARDETIERMEQAFETYPAKTGTYASDGFVVVVKLSEQYREGDTLRCRYTVQNEGLPYQISHAYIIPLGAAPLQNVTIAVDGGEQLPLELPPGAEVSGSIHVKEGAAQLANGFKLQLIPSRAGILPAPVGFKDPAPNEGRLSLQLEGVVGAISLKSTADATQEDFTTLEGLGGRMVYGFNKRWSVEGSLSALTTQQAEFDDGSTAEATTVRALIGGLLHFGETTVPYLRVGIGARLSSYTLSSEEDSKLRGSALVHLGGGVDHWLGERLVVGASAQYVGGLGNGSDDSYSLEFGAHIGFAWKP